MKRLPVQPEAIRLLCGYQARAFQNVYQHLTIVELLADSETIGMMRCCER
jgi:hypothetical protein